MCSLLILPENWSSFSESIINLYGILFAPFSPTVAGNLPPGDTHVVYPGPEGPLSSTRLEAHRIGFEDCELLKMLKAKDPEHTRAIINNVIRSFSDYTKEPKIYRTARRELLEALD